MQCYDPRPSTMPIGSGIGTVVSGVGLLIPNRDWTSLVGSNVQWRTSFLRTSTPGSRHQHRSRYAPQIWGPPWRPLGFETPTTAPGGTRYRSRASANSTPRAAVRSASTGSSGRLTTIRRSGIDASGATLAKQIDGRPRRKGLIRSGLCSSRARDVGLTFIAAISRLGSERGHPSRSREREPQRSIAIAPPDRGIQRRREGDPTEIGQEQNARGMADAVEGSHRPEGAKPHRHDVDKRRAATTRAEE